MKLSQIITTYRQMSEQRMIFNKKTGVRLSDASLKTNIQFTVLIEGYIKKHADFDFKKYNVSTISKVGEGAVNKAYDRLSSSLKNYFESMNQDGFSTIPKNLARFKTMVTYVCEMEGINVGNLLKNVKATTIEKPVITMSAEQVEFIIKNYDQVREGCLTMLERYALQYWYVALVLNPRRSDMEAWQSGNLFQVEGATWIKYRPQKTKNSSSIEIECPVPAKVQEIFADNLQRFKKLMPKIDMTNINRMIKDIARRYEIFQNEIQVYKKGEYKTVKMCDYVHIHMARSSGMSHKLMSGWGESFVKELSGHTHDSKAFKRYVKIGIDAKARVANSYFNQLGL